jgi:hypothetical protein
VLGGQLPTLRLIEVVYQHVDLFDGSTVPSRLRVVRRAVTIAIEGFRAGCQGPAITLHSDEGDTWSIAGGAHGVPGGSAAMSL